MSDRPAIDFARHVGQETTFRELMRAAGRACKRFRWQALGCGALWWLINMVTGLVVGALAGGMAVAPLMLMSRTAGDRAAAQVLGVCLGAPLTIAATGFVFFPLLAGYLWSVARTYDGRPMSVSDLFDGFNRQRYKTLMRLGLLSGAALAVVQIGTTVLQVSAGLQGGSRGLLGGIDAARVVTVMTILGMAFAGRIVIQGLFFLTYHFAMSETMPEWRKCLEYNWRAFMGRPGQFVVVVCLPAAALLAVGIVAGVPGAGLVYAAIKVDMMALKVLAILGVVVLAAVIGIAAVVIYLYWAFLWSGFFRTSYGYTLEMPPEAPATAGPSGVGGGAAAIAPGTLVPPGWPAEAPAGDPGEVVPGEGPASGGESQVEGGPEGPPAAPVQ